MTSKNLLSLVFVFFSSAFPLTAEEFATLFPFVISNDTHENITNIAAWNDAPAGKHGFIRTQNGHFIHDKGRFLIWGTNLAFSANFPDKDQAEKLAARLARFGFNCIRLHHMDSHDIWGTNQNHLTIDPLQLDKLDYLIYQLKLRGIYVNINLHVSRKFDDSDGFSGSAERPEHDKGVDNFYPPFIDLQKKYARDLLTHVNPYTKTAYFEEPAVSMIEINNENSVVVQWASSRNPKILNMPEPYLGEFRKQWNDFLKQKYKTDEALAEAWKIQDVPLGNEMLKGESESQKWFVETDSETVCSRKQNGNVFRIEIEKNGKETWHPQLIARKLTFESGKVYTFSIKAKGDQQGEITIGIRRDEKDYDNLGFFTPLKLTAEWQTFTFTFIPKQSSENARFDIGGLKSGTACEFMESTLKSGGKITLPPGQSLQEETIALIDKDGFAKTADAASERSLPLEASDDFCEFLFDIEKRYWLGMYRFLKDEIKVRQPVSGTQVHYGSTTIQSQLDYVDAHSYWNHPHFPNKSWDMNDWTISNRALVNSLDRDILTNIAVSRVHGKPYTVSEFDAPFPNQYAAEALPILAAFGRFQDWDGIFHFAYSHNKSNFETKKITSFFDMVGNTVKLAHLPACAALFRRGDVKEGTSLILGKFDAQTELDLFKKQRHPWNFSFQGIGIDPKLALFHKTALDVAGQIPAEQTIPHVPNEIVAFGNDWHWQKSGSEPGRTLLINTANTKLFTGFNDAENKYDFGEIILTLRKTRLNWATISLVSMNGNGFDPAQTGGKPIRILAVATGLMQNSNRELEQLEGSKVTLGNKFGDEPILCEGIPFSLQFIKGKELHCYPLDENGNRRDPLPAEENNVNLSPGNKTIWYEIEVL